MNGDEKGEVVSISAFKYKVYKEVLGNGLFCCNCQITAEIKAMKKELRRTKTVLQLDELKCRKRVLRRSEEVLICFCGEPIAHLIAS